MVCKFVLQLWPAPLIAALTCIAYSNTFGVPFLFDDVPSILDNDTLSHLGSALFPPNHWGVTVAGRPVLNFSLALSHTLSGSEPWGYHLLNLLFHLVAALALFGCVRRTLVRAGIPEMLRVHAIEVAAIAALLWAVHPLQTEAVTYLIQRAESLMGMFYLLTVYAALRAFEATRPRAWQWLAVAACFLGAGTKEVIATAPLLVLLYDRTFVSGNFRNAWRTHRGFYLGLASTWLWLAFLIRSTGGDRGGTFSFTAKTVSTYWASQTEAVLYYLRLAVWPHPLVFDYGLPEAPPGWKLPVYGLGIVALVGATGYALWKWPRWGFLGAWFLVILAPTSVVPGTIQAIVEHRLYLPLAAFTVAIAVLAVWKLGRLALVPGVALAIVATGLTLRRNHQYRSDLELWGDTVAKAPRSAIAHGNLGSAYFHRGDDAQALVHFAECVRLDPRPPNSYYNLGLAYARLNRPADALAQFETAYRLNPKHYVSHFQAGDMLHALGRRDEAEAQYRKSIELKPDFALPHQGLGILASEAGQWGNAAEAYRKALQLDATLGVSRFNLGVAEFHLGQFDEALRDLRAVPAVGPGVAGVHYHVGVILAQKGDREGARAEYVEAIKLNPDLGEAQLNYGVILAEDGSLGDALTHLEKAVAVLPSEPQAHGNLANVLAELGRWEDAVSHYRRAVELDPRSPIFHYNLANAYARMERLEEAEREFTATARLDPSQTQAAEAAAQLREYLARRPKSLQSAPSEHGR